ncbi:hypothetical protein AB0O14_17265 [Microbacterium foliorum]
MGASSKVLRQKQAEGAGLIETDGRKSGVGLLWNKVYPPPADMSQGRSLTSPDEYTKLPSSSARTSIFSNDISVRVSGLAGGDPHDTTAAPEVIAITTAETARRMTLKSN